MLLISWNVNGLRAVLGRTLPTFIAQLKPDMLCLQEIKAEASQVADMAWCEGYTPYWCSAKKKGYSGTLILTRRKALSVSYGIGLPGPDDEGRVISAEYKDFYLVNVYTPNAKRALERLEERTTVWDPAFLRHLKKLEKKKPVVTCGDFNVAHREIDLANPKSNTKNAGFTPQERAQFDNYISKGKFIDTFREFEQGPGHYSWWSALTGARARNAGWRIDYFLISQALRPKLKRAFIMPEVLGSDHCPVGIELV
ncbi:MAG: exodeoxyribonuclease III [bacterium]|nr:exodeoxyribonuclease III [bacterium]